MANEDRPASGSADAGVGKSATGEGDLQELLLLRAALALVPIYLRRVSLTDPPPRRR